MPHLNKDQQASYSLNDYAEYAYRGANLMTTIVITNAAIIAVQNPLKTLMLNHIKTGSPMPDLKGGFLAAGLSLYRGLGASLAGSGIRTAYVTTAKKGKTAEVSEIHERTIQESEELTKPVKKARFLNELGYVAAASLGDVFVTQISESLGQLQKLGIIEKGFKWKTPDNTMQLLKTGFAARYSTGIVNFAALCMLEQRFAAHMPFESQTTNHLVAGALSGMTASVVSYPFSYFKDYALSRVTVRQGQLTSQSTKTLMQEGFNHIKSKGLSACAKQVGRDFLVQAPMRMGLTGAIFAIIAGVGQSLGEEPLARFVDRESFSFKSSNQGFFSQANGSKIAVSDKTAELKEPPRPGA